MSWLRILTEQIAERRPVALGTVVEGPLAGRHLVLSATQGVLADELGSPVVAAALASALEAGARRCLIVDGLRVYMEAFLPPPELLVIGAGHVAQPVAQLGKLLGFTVTVIDDRPQYALAARFPAADRVICADFVPALQGLVTGPQTYAVLVTRGHRHDMECLRELVGRPLAYIGMIGSRIRVETVFRLLAEEHGIDPQALEQVYAPIGLDLNARTPAEIAVAVAAELLKVRRGGTGQSLSRLDRGKIHGR
ncbi:MAG TPA: XdhC family protein [Symbiobacteriaceae bacterium]|nr:XdhC family protein [Symbiobacteriaceae bacterium]